MNGYSNLARVAVTDTLNNIFQKYCSHCEASSPKEAVRCSCGYSFESSEAQEALLQALEDEKLYEDYLAARLKQASQVLIEMEKKHKADLKDPSQAAQTAKAFEETEAIRKELAAQSAKVAELTKLARADHAARALEAGRSRLAKEAERVAQKASARRLKACPRCKMAIPGDVDHCKCGYVFPEEQLDVMPSSTSGAVTPIPDIDRRKRN